LSRFGDRQVFDDLVLCFLLFGNLLSRPNQPPNLACGVPHGKPVHRDPTLFTVGSDNPESFVELSGSGCFIKLRQHTDTIFRVNEFLVRSWIVE
jgi:hypothetical protein